jgi:hypothetical protein
MYRQGVQAIVFGDPFGEDNSPEFSIVIPRKVWVEMEWPTTLTISIKREPHGSN